MGGSASKKATFYHDYGSGGWVFIMRVVDMNILTYAYDPNDPNNSARVFKSRVYGDSLSYIAPTVSQYPRPGKVNQHSDNNISFSGGGVTYTLDMGPYVADKYILLQQGVRMPNSWRASVSSSTGTMMTRATDPYNFRLVDPSRKPIPFQIRKIDGDARSWPGWYLWVAEPVKAGSVLAFDLGYHNGNTTGTPYLIYNISQRLGDMTGGVRYAPAVDAFSNSWGLQRT